jgi:ATP-dependent helicase/nuclease subunit A
MADMQFTPAQQCAIDSRQSTVLVSAAAGSGKTRVLTERLMAYLTDGAHPVDIDRFLVITFTKAAAGELRSRILSGIAANTAAHPELRRQTALCARAQIGTIHSFCGNLLREHCAAAALSPDFQIADENQTTALKAATLEKVLEAAYADIDTDEALRALADTVGAGRDDKRLAELILQLYEKMQSHARPEQWAAEQIELLDLTGVTDVAETTWGKELLDAAKQSADYWCAALDRLRADVAAYSWLDAAYGDSIDETGETFRAARRAMDSGWDAAHYALAAVTFPKLGRVVKPPEPEAKDRAKNARDRCKKAVEKLQKQFSQTSEKMLDDLRAAAPAMVRLLRLTMRFTDAYAAEKRRRDLVDYADLEHMAARLLTNEDGTPSALAKTVSERFREILVDEYQDVSEVQDLIFRAVSRDEKNLFFVGDVKQSIYRFRLADPTLFLAKYDAFTAAERAEGDESRRILLHENFRSRGAVLSACNHVFRNIMSRALGELSYDDDAALKCGLPEMEGGEKAELCLVQLPGTAEGPGPEKHALEAQYVAGRMIELNNQGVPWGDMVILLRSANSVGPIYREALTARGIPVQSEQGGGFFESLEISMVRSLLAVIDNPHQDVPLVAALTSPLFGFNADALAAVRESDRTHDFYTALCKRAETDGAAKAAVETIALYRRLAPDSALTALLWQIYDDRDLMALCSAMPDGDQRRANLHRLLALSESFERTGYQGLHRFVQWLDQQEEQGREPGAAAPAAQSVKIMSIHRSKGLEFPVVFLCDLNRQFNKSDSSAAVLVHPKLGLGPKRYDLARGISYPTFARNAIAQRLNRETLSEEMRLLYVAMTRAKDRLILTGTAADAEGLKQKLALDAVSPLPPEVLQTAVSPLYWLLQAALLPGGEDVFDLRIVEPEAETEASARADALCTPPAADPAALEALETALTFSDPHAAAAALPSKVTATELKRAGFADPEEDGAALLGARRRTFRMPDFREEDKPLTPTERGTATHRVLQYLHFTDAETDDAVRAQIADLVRAGYLSERDARAVKVDAVRSLMRSPLGKRLYAAEEAGTVRREFRFSLLFPANRLFGGEVADEVLLQGVVDCWWEEPDGVVILDYKTDRIPRDAVPERTAYYAGQLRAYGEAMARITGKPVKERLLFFLHNGVVSEVSED